MRKAIETGKRSPLAPERVTSFRTLRAQEDRLAQTDDFTRYSSAISPEDRAEDWSGLFARSSVGEYQPDRADELGVSRAQYTAAYLDAFVLGDTRYSEVRHSGGSDALFYWLVVLNEYMTVDEYEARYGGQGEE